MSTIRRSVEGRDNLNDIKVILIKSFQEAGPELQTSRMTIDDLEGQAGVSRFVTSYVACLALPELSVIALKKVQHTSGSTHWPSIGFAALAYLAWVLVDGLQVQPVFLLYEQMNKCLRLTTWLTGCLSVCVCSNRANHRIVT